MSPGPVNQPIGTTVQLEIRNNPFFYSTRNDEVRIVDVVYGYALACEFPIEGTL